MPTIRRYAKADHRLTFTTEEREAAQAWHDAHDVDDQGVTADQRLEMFRRQWAEEARIKAESATKLRSAPPCPTCGAGQGQKCKKL